MNEEATWTRVPYSDPVRKDGRHIGMRESGGRGTSLAGSPHLDEIKQTTDFKSLTHEAILMLTLKHRLAVVAGQSLNILCAFWVRTPDGSEVSLNIVDGTAISKPRATEITHSLGIRFHFF